MRIDFNVLWVDDQPGRVNAQIEAIKIRMEAEGFLFNPTLCESPDKLAEQISDSVFNDEIDLILVDWDLGAESTGQDAIAVIREKIQYKDVVFYSALKPANDLRRIAYEARLEGVYCTARDGLVEEVLGVFESLVKKVLDIDHARGIVMGATSDIDNMVNECLVEMHQLLDETGQQELLIQSLERISERTNELIKKFDGLREESAMSALFAAHDVFTANDRLRILSRLLKRSEFERHKATRPSVIEYMSTVVPVRNELGHIIFIADGKPKEISTTGGKSISLDEVRTLRRKILAIRTEFREMLGVIRQERLKTILDEHPEIDE
ncbi:MAG: hypothetical protein KF762_02830 [Acidobacteria bacterium]|nr:hypothetical protein [Acidobacteriota bacterium]